jgi:M3 family oligoendopeptidase
MTYKYYTNRAEHLTKEFLIEEYRKLTDRVQAAEASETSELWLKLYADWNALSAYGGGEGSRLSYALAKNMESATSEEAFRYFREEVIPIADNAESELVDALHKSKYVAAIGERYGKHLIEVQAAMRESIAPINNELRVKAGDLSNKYDKIVSQAEVMVGGKKVTATVARNMTTGEADPKVREEAYRAHYGWFLEHRQEIASIYGDIVKLRDEMGRNLGHKNFIPLGYASMRRTDYGPKEVKTFREAIRKYVVPLQTKLYEMQAEELGTATLRPWDSGYSPSLNLPTGIAPVATQLDNAQKVFEALSPRLAAHFTRMRKEGLIDLENRKGKQAGAFCTSFSDEGRVAILCNSTGDEVDVTTLIHEMGHAFQAWESQVIEAVDLQWPTSDAAEVHSMGMEYLSLPEMTKFYSQENADKVQKHRWKSAVHMMCYIAIVDEFQHWVYENPNCTLEERDAAWSSIWDIYQPGIDFTGLEQHKFARWYMQGHLFSTPFYYIDYAIAETGAMQLALMGEADRTKALDTYLKLCQMGGKESVLTIFKSAGLRSPFEPEVLRNLMEHAAKKLQVEEYELT